MLPWRLVSAEGSSLQMHVELGDPGCVTLQGVHVNEWSDAVEVTVTGTVARRDSCFPAREAILVTVTLDAPLGNRSLQGCILEHDPVETRTSCEEILTY